MTEMQLYSELCDSITKTLQRLPVSDGNNILESNLESLVLDVNKTIRNNDINIRKDLLSLSIRRMESWLDNNTGQERCSLNLAQQPCYVISRCLVELDPKPLFEPRVTAKQEKPPWFLEAAKMGADRLVNDMVRGLCRVLKFDNPKDWKEQLYHRLQWEDKSKNSALLFAAQGGWFGTMDILLEEEPRLAGKADSSLIRIVISGDLVEAFMKIIQYRSDLVESATLCSAISGRSHRIITFLTNERPEIIDFDAVRAVIKDDDPALWEIIKKHCQRPFLEVNCQVLHLAVQKRRKDIVEYIIQEAPSLATALHTDRDKGRYALWYINGDDRPKFNENDLELKPISQEVCQELRNIIVPAVIRSKKPPDIRQILKESNVTADEICLSLASFNASTHDFFNYVTRLTEAPPDSDQPAILSIPDQRNQPAVNGTTQAQIAPKQSIRLNAAPAIKFEKVLRYADFPDLNSGFPCSPDEFRTDHTEILEVLRWLHDEKGVDEIVKVKVADHLHTPQTDQAVEYCVQTFKVSVLNWRKLDLCLADLDPNGTLKKLHLYSSGNKAVIRNWLSENDQGGLVKLKNIEKLYIHVVEDVLSDKRVIEVKGFIEKKLSHLKESRERKWAEVSVKTQRWSKSKVEKFAKDLTEIIEISFPELAPFVERYKTEHRRRTVLSESRKTKVCLIDSGVIVVENTVAAGKQEKRHIANQIKEGKSFVYDGSYESPWWHASVPHGTQMASLICAIDPCCDLYIAKVGDVASPNLDPSHAPVTPERVADAVQWAISKKVDVISLSLVLTRQTEDSSVLRGAFKTAFENDIVVICSTSDSGKNWKDTWPAKYAQETSEPMCSNIFGVGACDKQGNRLDATQDKGYPFQFKGKDIYVGPIPFIFSKDLVTGSSVSTAIAAGVASLTLSCYRLAGNRRVSGSMWRWRAVRKKFRKMSREATEPRYVLLEKFMGRRFERTSDLSVVLEKIFGDSSEDSESDNE